MKKQRPEIRRALFALLIALPVFCFLFLLLKWSLFPALPLSALAYVGSYLMRKPVPRIATVEAELLKDGQEAKELLDNAKEKLRVTGRYIPQIKDDEYRSQVVETCKTATSLVQYLENNPSKIFKAQKFLTYQLDLALHSVKDYHEVKTVAIDNESMKNFNLQSLNIMKILSETYEQQFAALIKDKIMNMDVQHEILESRIKAEKGLRVYEK